MTYWIEWAVKREPILGNILYAYSRLSSEGWFLRFPKNFDFWLYNKGSWSAERPIEITTDICQRGVNSCADGGGQPGCCGPKGSNRCCNYNTNRCGPC